MLREMRREVRVSGCGLVLKKVVEIGMVHEIELEGDSHEPREFL